MTIYSRKESYLASVFNRRAARRRSPVSGTFELTPTCNMSCKMCYVRKTASEVNKLGGLHSGEEWINLAEKIKEAGTLFLLVTGGEPFMHPDVLSILKALHEMGMVVSLNTNATLLTEEIVEFLKTCPPSRINVTLYGSSNDTYKRLCGDPFGYDKAIRGIRLLKKAGMTVAVNVSVTPDNSGDLKDILDFAREENLPTRTASYMFPPVIRDRSSVGNNYRFTPEDAARSKAYIESYLIGPDLFAKKILDDHEIVMPADSVEECLSDTQSQNVNKSTCSAGKNAYWINWKGDLSICGMIPEDDTINVFYDDFDKAWKNAVKFADSIRLPAKCKDCSLRDQCIPCAASIITETGFFDKVPEYKCRMAHYYPYAAQELARKLRNEATVAEGE